MMEAAIGATLGMGTLISLVASVLTRGRTKAAFIVAFFFCGSASGIQVLAGNIIETGRYSPKAILYLHVTALFVGLMYHGVCTFWTVIKRPASVMKLMDRFTFAGCVCIFSSGVIWQNMVSNSPGAWVITSVTSTVIGGVIFPYILTRIKILSARRRGFQDAPR